MRPVLRKIIAYTDLHGTVIDLADIALINDMLDIDDENRARIAEAMKHGH